MFCWNVDLQKWTTIERQSQTVFFRYSFLLLLLSSSVIIPSAWRFLNYGCLIFYPTYLFILYCFIFRWVLWLSYVHKHPQTCSTHALHTSLSPIISSSFVKTLDLFIVCCCWWCYFCTKLSPPSYQRLCLCWSPFEFLGAYFFSQDSKQHDIVYYTCLSVCGCVCFVYSI